MDKVPHARAFADLCALVDDGGGVDGGGHGDGKGGLEEVCEEGVDFALLALYHLGCADDVDGFDAVSSVVQAVTTAREDFAIAGGVQIGEAFAEFELIAADVNVAVGGFFSLHFGGHVFGVNGQEPAHASAFVLQIASGFLGTGVVQDVAL